MKKNEKEQHEIQAMKLPSKGKKYKKMPILADYFMSVTVPPTEENIGLSNPPIEIVDRYPVEDHKKHRFPENSQYCCIPGDAKIKYVKDEKRRPYFFTFCFTLDDHSRSYGTSLFYYEKLKINGEYRYDKKGRHYYVPRSLCVLSHQPIFSVFSVFLRELYRNSIISSEDCFADEKFAIPRVESFEALLRKGSAYDVFYEDSIIEIPLEKYITHFVDFCPSLEPGILLHIPIFQKVCTLRIPPSTCLPYTDKLCFDCLYTSLSPKNIMKCIALLLQEERILLVSEQADSLTLCAQALISLIYPFRWYHPFVPIVPLTITESISASFPYLFGVTASQYRSTECQNNLEGVTVVYLDYDQVILPKKNHFIEMNNSIIKKFTRFVEKHIPPPATRVLYCNNKNIEESTFLVFEIVFGPGRLGVRLKSKNLRIYEDDEEKECTYLARIEDDMTITGPGKRVELLNREPVVISINGQSVLYKGHSEVRKVIEDSPRPLIMRCQIGILPSSIESLHLPSLQYSRMSSISSPVPSSLKTSSSSSETDVLPISRTSSPDEISIEKEGNINSEENKEEVDLRISFTCSIDSTSSLPWSPILPTPSDEECNKIHRHYNFIHSEKDKNLTYEKEKLNFYEKTRIMIMLELVRLIGHYKKHFYKDAGDGATLSEILNMKSFLKNVDEDDLKFVKKMSKTQLFQHFIEDAFEYEDNYEINLFNDCITIVKGMGDYAVEYIIKQLLPSHWDLDIVDIPLPTSDDVKNEGSELDFLDSDHFPRLRPELFGKKNSRMKITPKEQRKTIVPENMKEVVKEMKQKENK